MRYNITRDMEDALRLDLKQAAEDGGFSIYTSAPPVPEDLGTELPYVIPERVGGSREDLVVDTHNMSIDVYASEWGEAQRTASMLTGVVEALPYLQGLTADYYDAYITTLPYNNPDPRHQDVPRVTFAASVICRTVQA